VGGAGQSHVALETFSVNSPEFLASRRSFLGEAWMRNWLKNADSDDITMLVSGAVAVLAFCTFVMVWFIETPGPECGRNCSTDFSSVNK
jgi:hypothetical protein